MNIYNLFVTMIQEYWIFFFFLFLELNKSFLLRILPLLIPVQGTICFKKLSNISKDFKSEASG